MESQLNHSLPTEDVQQNQLSAFLRQFFEQEKEEARADLRREMDALMDRQMNKLMDRVSDKLTHLISNGGVVMSTILTPALGSFLKANRVSSDISSIPLNSTTIFQQQHEATQAGIQIKDEIIDLDSPPPIPNPADEESRSFKRFTCNATNVETSVVIKDESEEEDCSCEDCGNILTPDGTEESCQMDGKAVETSSTEQSDNIPQQTKRPRLDGTDSASNYAPVEEKRDSYQDVFIATSSVQCFMGNCGQSFASVPLLELHLQVTHGTMPFCCLFPGCECSFPSGMELASHTETYHSQVSVWSCTQCVLSFSTHGNLTEHFRLTHHLGTFGCSFAGCGYASTSRTQVFQHYRQAHGTSRRTGRSLRTHVCTFPGCRKVFTEPGNLRTHERIHTGIRPYQCRWPDCTYAAMHSSDTIKHIRMKHFRVPRTKKEQREKNIVDSRNAHDYMQVLEHLLN